MRQGEDGLGDCRPHAGRGPDWASRATNAGLYVNGPERLRWTNFHHRKPRELFRNDSAVFRKGSERFRKPELSFAKPALGFGIREDEIGAREYEFWIREAGPGLR